MNILQTYLNQQLVKAGFPDGLKIEYHLDYCQGDGVAFYGRLYQEDLIRLFNHLNPSKRKQNMFTKLLGHLIEWGESRCIRISKNWFGYRYANWNCMEIVADEAEYQPFFSTGKKDWYFPKGKVHKYMTLWDEFLLKLKEHIQCTSKYLATVGYQIAEATPREEQVAYCFNTVNYRIELVQTPCEFYAEKPEWLFGDLCDVDEMMQSVVEGKIHFANLYAQVLDKQTGLSLGEDHLSNLSFSPKDRFFSGYKTELISNAIADARRNVQKYAQLHA
ncbi:hypothetical protein B0187_00985 [Haemophilus paracuniculus]|uniref:Uncharacterized protein n=1 Tax=Haemophilus paracuniculus TaxID=734 RepID=A0A1T0AVT0_9PAST|nr:SIMPL domain-containing protein [Haemophilus paracuniculus]OOS00899.1 hypothetical protein B0187_00985 [Haemophilus paracuniculus]